MSWTKYILFAINMQWLCHILISGWLFFMHINKLSSKKEKNHPINLWIGLLLISVTLLWLLYFFVSFSYFVVGSITFSALFYSFFLYFVFNKKVRTKIFPIQKKNIIEKIDNSTEAVIIIKLNTLMIEQKPYKNPNLKLKDLAEYLELSSHQVSQLLNDNLGKSFSEFTNEYRIEEAKQLIQSNSKYTLEAIGNESGFNSKSMFYKYFKSIVGMTPKKYKEGFLSS
ncbi:MULTISPECIES: helix-turn-helix domain-containing protein [Aquimarina]|uniref:helix-turn-helix domain-containing protein n=1 Tax=Aquimarina TaxID=290174 RepID=UPI00131F05FA|nr:MULTISPECIES: helix-turn-helix domain-containing protein [Aquimarina]